MIHILYQTLSFKLFGGWNLIHLEIIIITLSVNVISI